jgi:hypothetical protein
MCRPECRLLAGSRHGTKGPEALIQLRASGGADIDVRCSRSRPPVQLASELLHLMIQLHVYPLPQRFRPRPMLGSNHCFCSGRLVARVSRVSIGRPVGGRRPGDCNLFADGKCGFGFHSIHGHQPARGRNQMGPPGIPGRRCMCLDCGCAGICPVSPFAERRFPPANQGIEPTPRRLTCTR